MYKEADWELFRAHLATIQWDTFFDDCADVEEKWHKLKILLNNLTLLYVPVKTFNSNDMPWYNNKLKRMKRRKQRKWLKYKNNRTRRNLSEYRSFSKLYDGEIEKTKAAYEKKNIFG